MALTDEELRVAIAETATSVEVALAVQQRPEERLRQSLAGAVGQLPAVAEARFKPEWRPEMPFWPHTAKNKLGGFDLAIRLQCQAGFSLVVEVKWSRWGLLDALDEAPWDLVKLAHAVATLPEVNDGLLVYAASEAAWNKPARFGFFFEDGVTPTRWLIENHQGVWRWLLKGSAKALPVKLPARIETRPIGRASLRVADSPWEIRASSIRPDGDDWLELADGWPVPEQRLDAL